MKLVWKSRVIVFSHLLFCCVLFQNVKETQASQSRLLRFGQSVMSNCCIICFICANKAVIEMKRWRWARKRWRLHSVSHSWHNPSLHRSELSTLSAPWSKEGHVRAGWGLKGRQECRGNWCIEVMHLCTALCIVLWHETPPPLLWGHTVESRCNKDWLFSERESSGPSLSILQCVRLLWISHLFKQRFVDDEYLLNQRPSCSWCPQVLPIVLSLQRQHLWNLLLW